MFLVLYHVLAVIRRSVASWCDVMVNLVYLICSSMIISVVLVTHSGVFV